MHTISKDAEEYFNAQWATCIVLVLFGHQHLIILIVLSFQKHVENFVQWFLYFLAISTHWPNGPDPDGPALKEQQAGRRLELSWNYAPKHDCRVAVSWCWLQSNFQDGFFVRLHIALLFRHLAIQNSSCGVESFWFILSSGNSKLKLQSRILWFLLLCLHIFPRFHLHSFHY